MLLHLLVYCSLHLAVVVNGHQPVTTWVKELNEDNWDRMLTGEWMVEFYAPWCPACQALEPIWETLAKNQKDMNVNVGRIDVTASPGLNGRFMVTALPTIYHVKDGVFRQYKSPRDENSLRQFVDAEIWKKVEPISSWKNPTSVQMSIVSYFFRMSQVVKGMHSRLMEDFGLPTWASYLIFAIATILIGSILGLFIVWMIDLIYPPKPEAYRGKKKQKESSGFMQEKSSGDEEIVENIKDDLVDEDSESEETEGDKEKDSKAAPSSPNVRKRKPRKDD